MNEMDLLRLVIDNVIKAHTKIEAAGYKSEILTIETSEGFKIIIQPVRPK